AMTPVLWAATGVVQPEATNPDTAAPASASRRFVSMLIIVLRRSFNATIGGDDYHDHRKRTLLRRRRKGPRRRRAAEQRDELVRFAPKATEVPRCRELTRCARSRQ